MLEQPSHGSFGIAIASRKQGFLTTNRREAHGLELGERDSVEFGSRSSFTHQSMRLTLGKLTSRGIHVKICLPRLAA